MSAVVSETVGTVTVDRAGKIRAVKAEEPLIRGEIIKTGADGMAFITIGPGVRIALDEKTDLVLESLRPDGVRLHLSRGRILAASHPHVDQLTIKTAKTETMILEGTLSIVNYDFLQTVAIAPLNTTVRLSLHGSEDLWKNTPVHVLETSDPPIVSSAAFSLTSPDVKKFYDWAKERVGFTKESF